MSRPFAVELRHHARQILDGTVVLPRLRSSRAAAVLARQALEDTVIALCAEAAADVEGAKMRTRLVVLQAIAGEQAAMTAQIAWAGLSRACHHHAYELTPTESEVRYLLDLVDDLAGPPSSAAADQAPCVEAER